MCFSKFLSRKARCFSVNFHNISCMTEEKIEEKKAVVVPEKFAKLVEEIEKMSVLDLSELVKVLEEKFGVSAAAPIMMGARCQQA